MRIVDLRHGKRETYDVREVRNTNHKPLKEDKDEELSALEKRLDSLEEKLNELLSKDEDEGEENDEEEDDEEAEGEDELGGEEDDFEGERVEDVKTTCDSVKKPIPNPLHSIGALAKSMTDSDDSDKEAEEDKVWSKYYDSKLKGDK